jgi:hypothetical protein
MSGAAGWLGVLFLPIAMLVVPHADAADDSADLYQSQAIVTGTGEPNRRIGFKQCLERVLVRVSGDQRLLRAPGLDAMMAKAGDYVASFRYHDRMAGIPIHDEQGTHDRPHDLTCIYDPAVVDGLLGRLGRKPWIAARPRLAVFLSARNGTRSLTLSRDGKDGFYMRDSFELAAEPLAIPIVFPEARALRDAGIDPDTLPRTGMPVLDALARQQGGDQALAGAIVWSDRDLGWVAEWRLDGSDGTAIWQVRGVSFDEAFRDAMRGAAQILSGNGTPD